MYASTWKRKYHRRRPAGAVNRRIACIVFARLPSWWWRWGRAGDACPSSYSSSSWRWRWWRRRQWQPPLRTLASAGPSAVSRHSSDRASGPCRRRSSLVCAGTGPAYRARCHQRACCVPIITQNNLLTPRRMLAGGQSLVASVIN